MKINYGTMQNLFHAIRTIDSNKDVTLDVKTRVALALNMQTIQPYVQALEKKGNEVMTRERQSENANDGMFGVRVETAMREELAAEVDLELRTIPAADLALEKNKSIGPEVIRCLLPILTGLEELA